MVLAEEVGASVKKTCTKRRREQSLSAASAIQPICSSKPIAFLSSREVMAMINLLLPIFKLFPSRSLRYVPIRAVSSPENAATRYRAAYGSSRPQRKLRVNGFRNTNQISS